MSCIPNSCASKNYVYGTIAVTTALVVITAVASVALALYQPDSAAWFSSPGVWGATSGGLFVTTIILSALTRPGSKQKIRTLLLSSADNPNNIEQAKQIALKMKLSLVDFARLMKNDCPEKFKAFLNQDEEILSELKNQSCATGVIRDWNQPIHPLLYNTMKAASLTHFAYRDFFESDGKAVKLICIKHLAEHDIDDIPQNVSKDLVQEAAEQLEEMLAEKRKSQNDAPKQIAQVFDGAIAQLERRLALIKAHLESIENEDAVA